MYTYLTVSTIPNWHGIRKTVRTEDFTLEITACRLLVPDCTPLVTVSLFKREGIELKSVIMHFESIREGWRAFRQLADFHGLTF